MADRITAHSTTDSDTDVRTAIGLSATDEGAQAEGSEAETPPAEPKTSPNPDDPEPAEGTPASDETADANAVAKDDASGEVDDGDDDGDGDGDVDGNVDPTVSDAGRKLGAKGRKTQKRIDYLLAQVKATAEERDANRAEIARLRAEMDAKGKDPGETPPADPDAKPETTATADEFQEAEPTEPDEPQQNDFNDWDLYEQARDKYREDVKQYRKDYKAWNDLRTDWLVEQKLARKAKAEADRRAADDLQKQIDTRFEKAREKHPDIDDVIEANKDMPIPADVIHYIHTDTEIGPEIAYYLATHREEASTLMEMTPRKAVATIAQIEARLLAESKNTTSTSPPPAKPAKGVPVSKAPAPVSTVRTGSASAVQKDPDDMTQAEFNAWRDEQDRRRRVS